MPTYIVHFRDHERGPCHFKAGTVVETAKSYEFRELTREPVGDRVKIKSTYAVVPIDVVWFIERQEDNASH